MNSRAMTLLLVTLAVSLCQHPAPVLAQEGLIVASVKVTGLPDGFKGVAKNLGLSARSGLLGAGHPVFHDETLRADLQRLHLLLARSGYPYARITPEVGIKAGKRRVEVTFVVAPGRPVLVSGTRVEGAPFELAELADLARRSLPDGVVFTDANVQAADDLIALNLARAGYALGEVTTRIDRPDSFTAVPVFLVSCDELHHITRVTATGVPEDLVPLARKSLAVSPGVLYSPELLARGRDNLRELRLFRQIKLATVPEAPGELALTADLKPAAPRSARISVGTWSDDPVRVRGSWQHRNIFRGGRGLGFAGVYSPYYQEFGGRTWWPALLGPRSVVELSAGWIREDEEGYTLENRAIEGAVLLRPTGRLSIRLSAALENVIVSGTGDDQTAFTGPDGRLLVLGTRVYDDRSDHLLYPTRGSRLTLDLACSPPGNLSVAPFASIEGKAAGYVPLPGGLVLASRAALGVAKPLGEVEDLLPNHRFFAGGVTTMRGYKRRRLGPLDGDGDPIGGQARLLLATELRTPLTGWLELATFLDAGQVWSDRTELTFRDIETAGGGGLVFHTPVGPVRLDLAHLLKEPSDDEPRTVFHLAIGHPF